MSVLLSVVFVLLAGAAVFLVHLPIPPETNLLLAVLIGGMFGGLTLALIGGEKLGLKLPGAATDSKPFEPGFLGDMFIGTMAAMVMFGVGSGLVDLKPFSFDPKIQNLIAVWLRNFAVAYLSGYLGLNLIKALSKQVIDKAKLAAQLEGVGQNKVDTAYLLGQQAIEAEQYDAAEAYMRQAIETEGRTAIRSLIGLAQVLKRKNRVGEALALLTQAIDRKDMEKMQSRVAVAYFNRACYYAIDIKGEKPTADEMKRILEDLTEAFELERHFARDADRDPDFRKVREEPEFKALIERYRN